MRVREVDGPVLAALRRFRAIRDRDCYTPATVVRASWANVCGALDAMSDASERPSSGPERRPWAVGDYAYFERDKHEPGEVIRIADNGNHLTVKHHRGQTSGSARRFVRLVVEGESLRNSSEFTSAAPEPKR